MKTQTLYVDEGYPGESVEEKTLALMASVLEAAKLGYDPETEVVSGEFVDQARKFKVTSATAMAGIDAGTWEVVIEGEDADIEAYEKASKELE